MVQALERAAHLADAMDAIRCCIITGEGEKSFCAGGDIEAWSKWSPENFGLTWVRHGHRAFDALARLRVPLIAVLNGHTLGGGLELAATADFRVAEPNVKFGLPETGLGIIPGWSGTQRAVRRFGSQTVRRMALLGTIFSADEALRRGIVDSVAAKVKPRRRQANGSTTHPPWPPRHSDHQDADQRRRRRRRRTCHGGSWGLAVADGNDSSRGCAFRDKRKPEFR